MGKNLIRLKLMPSGKVIEIPAGGHLQDFLFEEGVEFPCGGKGKCKSCKIKFIEGGWQPNQVELKTFSQEQINAGWRLACQGKLETDAVIEFQLVKDEILVDEKPVEFRPQEGLGVAVDLGTTTVVAQLLDLKTGALIDTKAELNKQAKYGADIMSRVSFALSVENLKLMKEIITSQIWSMILKLCEDSSRRPIEIKKVVIAGNSVMYYLFCGFDVSDLAYHPFEVKHSTLQIFSPRELDWLANGSSPDFRIFFLPPIASFVGSDILCGIVSTNMHRSNDISMLIDLGTNGEIVIGNSSRMLVASTAAGPAFEGAKISCGMRAASGAISHVKYENGVINCEVLGNGIARGICGSGLVDAVAVALQMGWINNSGRIIKDSSIPLRDSVSLTQNDIRELQLAKGAIAAGIILLAAEFGISFEEVKKAFLAGAFGNYISIENGRKIGLFPKGLKNIVPSGNTSLHGAKFVLFNYTERDMEFSEIKEKTKHLHLNELKDFETVFAKQLFFPTL
jgi:uncharacterized 2Fe-2S/4Fe-4S cluster protein (DUF4445 family)